MVYLFYMLLSFWRNISHSGENKCNQFQAKGNVEKAETREVTDFFLLVENDCNKGEGGATMNGALLINKEG